MAESELELPAEWGVLHGTLAMPQGQGPVAIALLVAGAGPADRNAHRALAQALAEQGVASLRYDKRGVGASLCPGLRESALLFDHLVEDAVTCALHLRQDARFGRLLLVGLNEGALVATLAAEHADAVLAVAGATLPAGVLMQQQVRRTMPPDLVEAAVAGLQSLIDQRRVEAVPDDLFLLLRPSIQPYLMSWFRHDPAQVLAGVRVPVVQVPGGEAIVAAVRDMLRTP